MAHEFLTLDGQIEGYLPDTPEEQDNHWVLMHDGERQDLMRATDALRAIIHDPWHAAGIAYEALGPLDLNKAARERREWKPKDAT